MRIASVAIVMLLGLCCGCNASAKKEKPEDFGPRFEAAGRIGDIESRDRALAKIAMDAMDAENPGATSWAISQISDTPLRDRTAVKAADYFIDHHRPEVAGAVAESISDMQLRDRVMRKLAETRNK